MWAFFFHLKKSGEELIMKFYRVIKENQDFQIVYKTGKSYANKYLVMYVRENQSGGNRLGISVSKKLATVS